MRLADAVPLDMIAVPFGGPLRFLTVAAPDYLASHPAPTVPDELRSHRCIRQRLPSGKLYQWEFEQAGEIRTVDVPVVLTLDHNGMMVEAAVAGMGIAYVTEKAAAEAVQKGKLVLVLESWCPPASGLCLYYPGRRHVPAGLRAFIDVLSAQLPN
ncbi:LysR substrate-binding domain-containing protein [Brucella cytisi]|uniref:LysR substrate-binding domain-containing protein n=1 Tax=Brucella cytisi TaxID=407152 RepID=UPI00228715B0|nr:LysR substrate-binding domain-containing protein [Brucella cytisi]